jgi:hypothetical protein
MAAASIETTLELWASSLRAVKARIRPLFTQERVAVSAGLFLDGVLGNESRKMGWMRAEAAGDPGSWRQQAILGGGRWARTRCATLSATTSLSIRRPMKRFWSSTETGFVLVDTGDTAHRNQTRPAMHTARCRDRMVSLARGSSSRSAQSSPDQQLRL